MPIPRREYYEAPVTTKPWPHTEFGAQQKVSTLDACHDLIRVKVPGGWLHIVKCTAHSGMSDPAFVADPEAQ